MSTIDKQINTQNRVAARGGVTRSRITVARPAPLSSIAFSVMRTTHLQVRTHAIAKTRIQIALAISLLLSTCTCPEAVLAKEKSRRASRLQHREVPGCNLSQFDSLFARSDISTRCPVRSQIGHLYKTSRLRSHISKRHPISDLTF